MAFVAPNLACGETRGGRVPCHGAVTDEQRSHRPNSAQPGGRQVFFTQTSLLAPHRSTAGYARVPVRKHLTPRLGEKSLAADVIVFMPQTTKLLRLRFRLGGLRRVAAGCRRW